MLIGAFLSGEATNKGRSRVVGTTAEIKAFGVKVYEDASRAVEVKSIEWEQWKQTHPTGHDHLWLGTHLCLRLYRAQLELL
jgi:hypothetical protein